MSDMLHSMFMGNAYTPKAAVDGRFLAGKSGTTSSWKDSWYVPTSAGIILTHLCAWCRINSGFEFVLQTVAVSANVYDVTMVQQPVKNSCRKDRIAHQFAPFAETFVAR